MPELEHESPKAKTPADEKRREQVLVGAALAGVVLTVLLLRRSSQAASATPIPVSAPIGNMGDSSNPGGFDFSSLANQIYGLQAGITQLQGTLGATSSPTAISHNDYSTQDVRDIFARFGDSTDALIGSDTVRPSTETGAQRVERLTRELNNGHGRSIDEITLSIHDLPHANQPAMAHA